MALVESVRRKCAFLARGGRELGLANVEVVNARAEEWPDGLGAQDVVTARALAPLRSSSSTRRRCSRPAALLVAWKGRREPAEEADGAAAAADAGDERAGDRSPSSRSRGARDRHLYLSSKVRPTPSRLPAPPGNGPQTAAPSLDLKVMALRRRTKTLRAPTGVAASLTVDGHDLRDREPEGRGGEDDDRGQRRRLHRRGRLRDAARRHRPAGERDRRARARRRTASRASTTSCAASATAEEALVADRHRQPARSCPRTRTWPAPTSSSRASRAPSSACARRWRRCATASPTRSSTARRRSAR